MTYTQYYFYSWLRENLASAIDQELAATIDQEPGKLRASIKITLDVMSPPNEIIKEDLPEKTIELYGPGDILGFDLRIVTRTDPGHNVGDFEPNYFPIIEFADPDFPWRFTPDISENLQPWIALIVLEDDEFKGERTNEGGEQGKRPDKQLPPVISGVYTSSLPDLSESWRWAHVQVTGEANKEISDSELKKIMLDEPERIISRLMCARRLKSGTKYHAFVVPTFRCGRSVGMGQKPDESEKPLSCAWDKSDDKIDLPYYHKWEFRTGQRGDFEHLVRLLEQRPLKGVGKRKIKCENLDDIPDPELELEGALCSPDTVFTQWGKDSNESDPFRMRLAELLNPPKADMAGIASDTPKVVPPIYGRWHAARNEVYIKDDNINKSWLDELNLDPRHRIAASIGAKVIKDQQESLMISAWDQLGDVEEANEKLRQAQLGMASSKSIYKRLPQDEDLLRLTAPVFSKVQMENRYTVQQHIQRSMVPLAICDPAFRRIQRPQGPIRKRQKAAASHQRLFERFSKGGYKVVRTHPGGSMMGNRTKIDTISTRVYEELDPRKKIIDRNKRILEREDPGIVMAHPTFPQPMYKFLQDISQELLLPGIEKIPQNTIGLLKTNRRFIEAYMCGLNHAFASELLWREYPTDQRGSYFRQFWDYSDYMSKESDTKENLEDIKPLDKWDSKRLGSNEPVDRPGEKLVMILRGDLLKKYPNAVIYAVEAKLKKEYLFSWDEIPGNDDERIIEFLKDELKIEWAKTENISKIDDGKTIIVSNKEKSLSLKINDEKTKVNLKIYDGRVDEFTVKTENGKLNIYKIERVPALPEFEEEGEIQSPVLSGTLQPDITFLGFNITEDKARGKTNKYRHGFYFVIEERVSETRFGLDESKSENSEEFKTWDDITWDHFKKKEVEPGDYLDGLKPDLGDKHIDEWNDGSANIAWITMQKPVRIFIHANRILP